MNTKLKTELLIDNDWASKWLSQMSLIWLFILLTLIGLFVVLPDQASSTLKFMVDNIVHIMPFVIASALLAGYLEAAGADQLVGRVFENKAVIAIFFAALLGALSPFCSCGVIPLIAALMVSGVPLAAIMAFWISSPAMDPAMFIVTSAGISWQFAVVKTISAIGLGLFAGYSTYLLMKFDVFSNPSKSKTLSACSSKKTQFTQPNWSIWKEDNRVIKFKSKSVNMIVFLFKWLTFAYLLESLMLTYVPAESMIQWLGGDSVFTVLYAALIGVPVYLNGFATVPLVAGLIENGMTSGAALAFMLAGSITSIPAAIAVYSLVKKSVFFWYLLLALTGSVIAGVSYNLILFMI